MVNVNGTYTKISNYRGHMSCRVLSVVFASRDNTLVYSGGSDQCFHEWDYMNLQYICPPTQS